MVAGGIGGPEGVADRRCRLGGTIVRDPGELERAWQRWRQARGLGESESAAESVASYVAHSLDHPWGRPRVVLGLDAEEARALAALLGREDAAH